MNSILARLKEPSTWAALTGMLAAFGIQLDPGLVQNIIGAMSGLAGVAAFFMREKGEVK